MFVDQIIGSAMQLVILEGTLMKLSEKNVVEIYWPEGSASVTNYHIFVS